MKAGTELKTKFKLLKRRLRMPLWQVKGILESLWNLTATDAIRGDIGRFTNEEIAAGIEYDGDEDELIAALVDTRWLDRCDVHRLVVHGWGDHAPNYVKGTVTQHKGGFVTASQGPGSLDPVPRPRSLDPGPGPSPPQEPKSQGSQGPGSLDPVPRPRSLDPIPRPGSLDPGPPIPNQYLTKPNQSCAASTDVDGTPDKSTDFDTFWTAYPRKVGKTQARKTWSRLDRASRRKAVAAVAVYAASRLVRESDPDLIPHPSTWLSGGRWDDDPAEWTRPQTRGRNGAERPPPLPREATRVLDPERDRELARGRLVKAFRVANGRPPDSDDELAEWAKGNDVCAS